MSDGHERHSSLSDVELLYLTDEATLEQCEVIERRAGMDAGYARWMKEHRELFDVIDTALGFARVENKALRSIALQERSAFWKSRFVAALGQIEQANTRLVEALRHGAVAAVEIALTASWELQAVVAEPARECLAPGTRLDLATGGASIRSESGSTDVRATVVSSRFPGATVSVDRSRRSVRVDFVDEEVAPKLLLVPWTDDPPLVSELGADDAGPFAIFKDVPEGEFLLLVPGQWPGGV